MARQHRMTPARRAALRKAQLVSARKRRKSGVRSSAKRAVSQRVSSTRASHALAVNRRASRPKRRIGRKVAKGLAIGVGVGALAAGGVAGTVAYSTRGGKRRPIRVHSSRPSQKAIMGSRTKALTMGPKGKATVAQRNRRARKRHEDTQRRARKVVGAHLHSQGHRTSSEIRASRARGR